MKSQTHQSRKTCQQAGSLQSKDYGQMETAIHPILMWIPSTLSRSGLEPLKDKPANINAGRKQPEKVHDIALLAFFI